ncbi:multicopper oxidase domain-containing protein, partial [Candidatus Woesearchaeota archaeon]|nr:multicopper oxidase domain-containing protein [Candidatus Woesearchaeota archaeon]
MRKIIISIFVALTAFLLSSCQNAELEQMHEEHMEEMQEHAAGEGEHEHEEIPVTFGPGESPHAHSAAAHGVDLARFEHAQDIARNPADVPLAVQRDVPETVKISLTAKEVLAPLAPGIRYLYWTFDGTVPGPFLRVREGDTIELALTNHNSSIHNHSIDLHAVTGPGGGAVLTHVEP